MRTAAERPLSPRAPILATARLEDTCVSTVEAVQTQLLHLGYYSGSIDGVFGPTTRDAVAKYQIANHLSVTGSLSPGILQSLGLPPGNGELSDNGPSR